MAKPPARKVIADNIRALLRIGEPFGLPTSQAELARRSGVAQTTLSSWLDDDRPISPGANNLEAVAEVFGLEAWQLFIPNVTDNFALAAHLKKLVANYQKIANPTAREYIDRVAEVEASYDPGLPRIPSNDA